MDTSNDINFEADMSHWTPTCQLMFKEVFSSVCSVSCTRTKKVKTKVSVTRGHWASSISQSLYIIGFHLLSPRKIEWFLTFFVSGLRTVLADCLLWMGFFLSVVIDSRIAIMPPLQNKSTKKECFLKRKSNFLTLNPPLLFITRVKRNILSCLFSRYPSFSSPPHDRTIPNLTIVVCTL